MIEDYSKYDFRHVVIKPKNISPKEIYEGISWIAKEFYSKKLVAKRLWLKFWDFLKHPSIRRLIGVVALLGISLAFRKRIKDLHISGFYKEKCEEFFSKESQIIAGKKGGTTTRKSNKGIFSPNYDRTLSAREAGKKGGAAQRDKKLGIFAMTDEQKKEASRKGSAAVRSQKWKCKITGYISNPCGLSNYQKSRGIDYKDKTLRERVG
jgi:hypothetical protein